MVAQLFNLGTPELIVILVIIVVVFGGSKLAGLGKASGQAVREFKDEIAASKSDAGQPVPQASTATDDVTPQTPAPQQ